LAGQTAESGYNPDGMSMGAAAVLDSPMQGAVMQAPARPKVTVAAWLENAAPLCWIVAAAGLAYIGNHFLTKGFDLNLNIANFTMMISGMIAYKTPIAYVRAIDEGIRSCGQLALQFPFYAGIMGMMVGSGLVTVFAGWLIDISTPATLPLTSFLSTGLVNIFIPSAGGQWAVQGPMLMEAAKALGVDYGLIILAFTHGDQWTNGIQPLWMLPLLGVTALKVNQVVGYTAVVMLASFFIWGLGLLFLPMIFI
jgi:short-chain fatty acids transporter